MVRAVNARADAGNFFADDQPEVLETLRHFNQVFAILDDRDAEWTRFTLNWAEHEGRLGEAAPEVLATRELTDEQIQALIDERSQAKRSRNFARADQIRNDLAAKGIILEDSKDGVRWKRR
jgi:cysteinyl-tRNA synthetase